MKDKICWVRQEDVPKVWIHKDEEYSHRLITKKDQNCSFSFHITTYEPNFDTIVEGDGIHEVVLYCLHGSSKQIDLSDNSCLLYTSPSPRDRQKSRMPSSA